MRKVLLLLVAGSLWACSDDKNKDTTDSGRGGDPHAGEHDHDASDERRDAGDEGSGSKLEQAPGSLERPPGDKLPTDLKPPGFAR